VCVGFDDEARMKLCIVIPVYNEAAIIKKSLEIILPYTRQLPAQVTVLLVNDCSQDNSEEIIKAIIADQPDEHLQMVSHTVNQGYGGANRTGAQYAIDNGFDYVLYMDSDLTNHPKYLKDFYQKMEEGYDYIKATRFSKGGGYEGVPWKRRAISRLGNFVGKLITGVPIHDLTNGFRAVKIDVLKNVKLTERHFSVIIEELMKSRKYVQHMCEIPNILGNREDAARQTAFTYDFKTYWRYFKYLFVR
jgi:dolichol-phosphate mannosyltransferase